MISSSKKFLFIHVPKTGGNSIQNILRDFADDEIVSLAAYHDGVERFEVRNPRYEITKHATLRRYKSVLEQTTFRQLYKFSVIRNPWERMISLYFSPHRGVTEWRRNDFLEMLVEARPARYFLCDETWAGRTLQKLGVVGERRIDHDVDFLIRFEQLEADFRIVCDKLDLAFTHLPHRNRSARRHYSAYYDDELKVIVGNKFRDEIEFGDYEFQRS